MGVCGRCAWFDECRWLMVDDDSNLKMRHGSWCMTNGAASRDEIRCRPKTAVQYIWQTIFGMRNRDNSILVLSLPPGSSGQSHDRQILAHIIRSSSMLGQSLMLVKSQFIVLVWYNLPGQKIWPRWQNINTKTLHVRVWRMPKPLEGLHASPRTRPSQAVGHDSGTGILEDVAVIRLVLAPRDGSC